MYQLSEKQIEYIINDIRARGVEMESLRDDLVDHVCCIIENQLGATGDFEHFYQTVIKTFYKKDLSEIEAETHSLLQNKNYYAMKKVMITGGIISAFLLTAGIILKFLHMPGAAVGIVLGISLFSFLFLPLLFALRLKEKQQSKDKVLIALGSFVSIAFSLGIMFKIMHWPGANMMGILSVGILFFLYLPINLVTGIKNPDTKINTIVTSILLVAGCGLFLSLVRSPYGTKAQYIKDTSYFVRNEQLFQFEKQKFVDQINKPAVSNEIVESGNKILVLCEEIKSQIIQMEIGMNAVPNDFIQSENWLGETYVAMYFQDNSTAYNNFMKLSDEIKKYNQLLNSNMKPISTDNLTMLNKEERVTGALNNLVQVQLTVLNDLR
jgi:hypothetical protein